MSESICKCGLARSYHGVPTHLADHEYEPRYPAKTEEAMSDDELGAHLRDILVCMNISPDFENAAARNRLRLVINVGIQEQARQIAAALLPRYLKDRVGIAELCDQVLDQSGNLLGYVRDEAMREQPAR